MHIDSDFNHRIAFLLFDVGVETLFKTFLTLPESVTHAQGSYSDRKRAAESNFHDLTRGVLSAAGSRLAHVDLSYIQFYHDLRNKLYHQGNGITIPFDQVKGYAEIAVNLLNVLLDTDLSDVLNEPKAKLQEKQRIAEIEAKINVQSKEVKKSLGQLKDELLIVVKILEPKLVMPSFTKQYENLYWRDDISIKEQVALLRKMVKSRLKNKSMPVNKFFIRRNAQGLEIGEYPDEIFLFYCRIVSILVKDQLDVRNIARLHNQSEAYPWSKIYNRPSIWNADLETHVPTKPTQDDLEAILTEGESLNTEILQAKQQLQNWAKAYQQASKL